MRKGKGAEGIPWLEGGLEMIRGHSETGETKYGEGVPLALSYSRMILSAATAPLYADVSCSSLAPCHYEGKYFTLGESWLRKDCFHCTCLHPVGVGCCDT